MSFVVVGEMLAMLWDVLFRVKRDQKATHLFVTMQTKAFAWVHSRIDRWTKMLLDADHSHI